MPQGFKGDTCVAFVRLLRFLLRFRCIGASFVALYMASFWS